MGVGLIRIVVIGTSLRAAQFSAHLSAEPDVRVRAVTSFEEAKLALQTFAPDLLVVDAHLKGASDRFALDLCEFARTWGYAGRIALVCSLSEQYYIRDAVDAGVTAIDFPEELENGLPPRGAFRSVAAIRAERARPVARAARRTALGLVGSSRALEQVREMMRRVAGLAAAVLVTGETGTGKELVARQIHHLGTGGKRPFEALNCAAIPREPLESELFGHERGAFTGASSRRRGVFEVASNGTLLLDEIGDLPPELQPKLLRALDDGEYRRLGSEDVLATHARVIAATSVPLEQRMAEGRFRRDLYYRLSTFRIHLPPLRERRGDIAEIAALLALTGDRSFAWLHEALAYLSEQHWVGNVRELENVIERVRARAENGTADRSLVVECVADLASQSDDACVAEARRIIARRRPSAIEVRDALARSNGNQSAAARELGISRPALRRLLASADRRHDEWTELP